GDVGDSEGELRRHAPAKLAALRAERGGGARGAEELHDGDTPPDGVEPLDVAGELREPDGELAAERDRNGRLRGRAAGHDRRAVCVGLPGDRRPERARETPAPVE